MLAYIHYKNGKYFLSKYIQYTNDVKELSEKEVKKFIGNDKRNFPIQIKL